MARDVGKIYNEEALGNDLELVPPMQMREFVSYLGKDLKTKKEVAKGTEKY